METTWDKLRAVLFALGIHALALAMLFVGLLWEPTPAAADAQGPMIEATLVSSPQQAASVARAIQSAQQKSVRKTVPREDTTPPPPQPKPEPKPQDAPQPAQPVPQAVMPKPDKIDQEEVRRVAEMAAEQKLLQEQEARHKQAQIDLSRQREQQDAENRQRLAQQQLEQQQKIVENRKLLAAAAREVKLKEERLKQLQDQAARLAQNTPSANASPATPPHPPSGNAGRGKDLQADYLKAIRETVVQNWQTGSAPPHVICKAHVKQIPGGQVLEVSFPACPFDAVGRQSVQDAFERTPLPYAGYEPVFLREFTIDLCYPEDPCK